MPIYADSTALIALGSLQSIDVLRHFTDYVFITPKIRDEVRNSSAQVNQAVNAGWMVVKNPDISSVNQLRAISRLDQGEAELIEVALRLSQQRPQILIDEARAFKYLHRNGSADLLCLAQVLHKLEDQGYMTSCQAIMDDLLNAGMYRWAKAVRRHYEAWCLSTGYKPV